MENKTKKNSYVGDGQTEPKGAVKDVIRLKSSPFAPTRDPRPAHLDFH